MSGVAEPAQTHLTTAVVGLGLSGLSCLHYLRGKDALVAIDDRTAHPNHALARADFADARFFLGPDSADPMRWRGVDRVVVSPGVAVDSPLLAGSEALPRLSDIDLFVAAARAPIIGITGTNGKSTVTALLGHMLRELGVNAVEGGNLGEPALDLLSPAAEAYVLELSSFQLEHSGALPLAAATVLNVSNDHLDRHGTLPHYAGIKQRIFAHATHRVFNSDDSLATPTAAGNVTGEDVAGRAASFGLSAGAEWRYDKTSKAFLHQSEPFGVASQFLLQGQHNALNLLAAMALLDVVSDQVGVPGFRANGADYVRAAGSFSGLRHRAELVRELAGVRYVNDSKATNVGACVAALEGYAVSCAKRKTEQRTVVLLAGGQSKGADLTPLGPAAASSVRHALLFGEDASALDVALKGHTTVEHCDSLPQAVKRAERLATAGDTVLLAPACASFDMFASFSERGERFAELVMQLPEAGA